MSYQMYCPNCRCNRPVSRWTTGSILILIFLLLMGVIFGLIYLIYKVGQPEKCSKCGCPVYMMKPPNTMLALTSAAPVNFCPKCGNKIDAASRFCSRCGEQLPASVPSAVGTADLVLEGDSSITRDIAVYIDGIYIGSFGARTSLNVPIPQGSDEVVVVLKGKYTARVYAIPGESKKVTVSDGGAMAPYYKFQETFFDRFSEE